MLKVIIIVIPCYMNPPVHISFNTIVFTDNHSIAIVKTLLRGGADPNECDAQNRTPLHDAIDNNYADANVTSEMEAALIAAGVDSAAVDEFGRMALHYAFIDKNKYVDLSINELHYSFCTV